MPDYVVSPGDHLMEWMDDNNLNAAELARRLDVTPKHVSELLSGKAPLSHPVAIGLERVTGIPARIWTRYESIFRSDIARIAEQSKLESQFTRASAFPLSYLRKWGFITTTPRDRAGNVSELLSILRIADIDSFDATWLHSKVAYRKVTTSAEKAPALATWLALGELQVLGNEELPNFEQVALEAALTELRTLTSASDPLLAIKEATSLLNRAGVEFTMLPPIPGLGVYGATRWIGGRPLIQLSLRGKSDDQFWFTLFHEIGHVLLHGEKHVFLSSDKSSAEEEADLFASRTLVPEEYVVRLPATRDIAAVQELAEEIGIAPSIVLGQAQRLTQDFAWGHRLKHKFEWSPRPVSAHHTH